MVTALVDAGLREIEVGSFVRPDAVPQMASSAELISQLPEGRGVTYRALWLNLRGLEQALAAGRISVEGRLTITASETFIRRNTNRSIDDTFADMPKWIARYRQAGITPNTTGRDGGLRLPTSKADVPVGRVVGLMERTNSILAEHGSQLETVRLADTMGWANPLHVKRLVGAVKKSAGRTST